MSTMFSVGDKFYSFSSLEEKLQRYQDENYVQFVVRDSKTIGYARRMRFKKALNAADGLVFFHLKFACTDQTKRLRSGQNTRPLKRGCDAHIDLGLSDDGKSLVIKSFSDLHNHKICKKTYINNLKSQVKELEENDNGAESEEVVLEDLPHLKHNTDLLKSKISLEADVQALKKVCNASIEVLFDGGSKFKGLFIQDDAMKQILATHPEFLFCDSTHKLLNLGLLCVFFLIENPFGLCEVVGVGLLQQQSDDCYTWLLDAFKRHNPNSSKLRLIALDNDVMKHRVFSKIFPHANIFFCTYHTLNTFKRDITCEKFQITNEQWLLAQELLHKIASSKTENEYNFYYNKLLISAPASVCEYFNKQWHPITNLWFIDDSLSSVKILNSTKNIIEDINNELNSVVNVHNTLEDFVKKLLVVLDLVKKQKKTKFANDQIFAQGSPERQYQCVLTPYAFHILKSQLHSWQIIDNIVHIPAKDNYEVKSGGETFYVTPVFCTCKFYSLIRLPCKHIFAVRNSNGISLFDKKCCDERWVVSASDESTECEISNIHLVDSQEQCELTRLERYKTAEATLKALAKVAAEFPKEKFDEKVKFLKQLLKHWKHGIEVSVNAENISGDEFENLSDSLDDEFNREAHEKYKKVKISPGETDTSCSDVSFSSGSNSEDDSSDDDINDCLKNALTYSPRVKPVSFFKKTLNDKCITMLTWFVGFKTAKNAFEKKHLIKRNELEIRPEKLPAALLDDNVDLEIIKKYFTTKGWEMVEGLCEAKYNTHIWVCERCSDELNENCLSCACCLGWYHYGCAGFEGDPHIKEWFCQKCYETAS